MMDRLNSIRGRLNLPGFLKKSKNEKTVNVFFGFFLIFNYCFGTGFLGIPYAFFYAGYLAALPTLVFITFISWINANYLLEIMARAQALEYWDKSQRGSLEGPLSPSSAAAAEDSDSEEDKESSASLLVHKSAAGKHPRFEISHHRKFEVAEMCQIFYNKYLKYAYLVVLSLHNFLVRWSFAAVAASAWAVNIPFRNFGAVEMCEEDAFLNHILPTGGCLYAYYFSLMIFAVIVVTLSLFELKQQVIIQLILGGLRFVIIISMVIYSIVQLAEGGDACLERLDVELPNLTTPFNIAMSTEVLKFNPRGLLLAIPIFSYAYLFHTGLSSLSHPIRPKEHLRWLVLSVFIVAFMCYFFLGISVSLWFRASIQETSTLSWALFTHPRNSIALRSLSYCIVIFPSVDVIAAYPLSNHVLVNNLYIFITGHDTSVKPRYKCDWCLRLILKIVSALLPIVAAFGVANLIHVLKFAGLVGFMCFSFPVLLQLKSIYVCKKRFSLSGKEDSSLSLDKPDSDKGGMDDGPTPSRVGMDDAPTLSRVSELKDLFLSGDGSGKSEQVYMTPYSSILFSHPTFVLAVGVVGVFVFFLAFLSLFLHPFILTCSVLLEEFLQ